jgi:hypothetical protein
VTTLLFDTAGLLIPFATGLGVAYKAGAKVRSAENVAEASTWTKRADTAPAACPLNSFTPDTDVVMADGTHKHFEGVHLDTDTTESLGVNVIDERGHGRHRIQGAFVTGDLSSIPMAVSVR